MPAISVGDMAQQFTSLRNGGAIKSDLSKLSASLSTGKVPDITKALNGQTARFSGIRYSLDQLDAFSGVQKETSQYLEGVQTILAEVNRIREFTSERLLLVNDSSTIAQVDEAAQSSGASFESTVQVLNTRIADRALLSGAQVDLAPLAPAEDMLASLLAVIPLGSDAATIEAAVANWFDDPAGFATMGYLGDTGPPVEKRISDSRSIPLSTRADDPAIVAVLRGAALAAVAGALPAIDQQSKSDLLESAGKQLFVASSDLIGLQARVGFNQAIVDESQAANQGQITTLGIVQNDLVNADPFRTATELQAVQLQLETHFAVTARMSNLSLLRYI